MKKLFTLLLTAVLIALVGCSNNATSSQTESKPKATPITKAEQHLVNANWVGNDGKCENHIRFNKDKSFINSCVCGDPVGDGDLVESYTYNKDNTISLFDCDGVLVETAEILFLDNSYLIINLWDKIYTYANQEAYVPVMHEEVTKHQDSTEQFACLAILDYKDNAITVASHYYDGDAKKDFKLWKLDTDENITVNSITVIDNKGSVSVENITLKQEDYQYIGEYYTHGFIEFDDGGKVKHITIYGETTIYGDEEESGYLIEENDQNQISIMLPDDREYTAEQNEFIGDFVAQKLCAMTGENFDLVSSSTDIKEPNKDYSNYNISIEGRTTYASDDMISVVFAGSLNKKVAAHPSSVFFTLNFNPATNEIIKFESLHTIDDALYQKFATQGKQNIIDENDGVWPEEFDSFEETLCSKETFFDGLKVNTNSINWYYTNEGIGFSYEVIHALGDHKEVEIKR